MRMPSQGRHLIALSCTLLMLAGCAAAPDRTSQQVMVELRSTLAATATQGDRLVDPAAGSVWWITREQHGIIDDGAQTFELRSYGCDSIEPNAVSRVRVARLDRAVRGLLLENGFARNVRNSSRSLLNDRFYDYVSAYERGVTKIVFTASPDCWSMDEDAMHTSIFVSMTEDLAATRAAQEPFLVDLRIGPEFIIHVTKQQGDFVMLAVNARRSGHEVIAKLVNDQWTQVYAGQDVPSCAMLRSAAVPEGFSDCAP